MSVQLDVSVKTTLPKTLKNIRQKLNNLPKEAYNQFYNVTPYRTGNAKSHTKLRNNKTIEADYPYAGVLDKGRHMTNKGLRGSEQAPEGMTKPTVEFIKRRVKQILRGK